MPEKGWDIQILGIDHPGGKHEVIRFSALFDDEGRPENRDGSFGTAWQIGIRCLDLILRGGGRDRRGRFLFVTPGGYERDPHFAAQIWVDRCAKDDVRLRMSPGADDFPRPGLPREGSYPLRR